MNGPEHFAAAELCLAEAAEDEGDGYTPEERAQLRGQALVHATLALAAATALHATNDYPSSAPIVREWHPYVLPEQYQRGHDF